MSISSISNDYYETLELTRDCSQEDITESFRRLSLKYLPKNAKDDNERKENFINYVKHMKFLVI